VARPASSFAAQAAARRAARLGVPLWLGLPVAWVGAEYLRSQTQLGFPWGLVGYGLIEHPAMLQFLSVTGIFGGCLFVALENGLVFAAVSGRGWGGGSRSPLAPAPLAALAPAGGRSAGSGRRRPSTLSSSGGHQADQVQASTGSGTADVG
jgi:apolipoprotein N-acyltransferase